MRKIQFASYRQVYGLLFRTYGKNWYVRLSFLTAIISRVCKFVGLPIAISQIVAALAAQDYTRAQVWVLVFIAFSATVGILSPITRLVAIQGENRLYADDMRDFFAHVVNKDVAYFNDSMTGYITTATRQYSDGTLNLVRKWRDSYLGHVFTMTVPIIVILVVNLQLGLVVLVLSLIQLTYMVWASQKIIPYRTKAREKYKQNSGRISDAITNIIAIKATAQEKPVSKLVGKNMFEESKIFVKRYKVQARLSAWREVLTVSFFATLFWLTVMQISHGAIGIAGAVLVMTYASTILTGIYEMSDAIDDHDNYIDMILPALELLREPNRIKDPAKPKKLTAVAGEITFSQVNFAYQGSSASGTVFRNLNLHIPAGQRVGIVGLSGAGKSTLAKLLLRFEDADSGSITIDGVPVTAVRQTDLRRNIAYVPQEPLLFHDTIRENIALAKIGASQKEIAAAAKTAYAQTFIKALPQGYESIVGERGVKLSGGQKQRIAIARAVLQDAPIVLLDEATSALDSESEQIIQESFAKIFKGRTAIVIAHRLSTIAGLDRIVLLHEGQIIEDGTHASLLKQKGIYAKLWHRQRVHPEDLEVAKDSSLAKL